MLGGLFLAAPLLLAAALARRPASQGDLTGHKVIKVHGASSRTVAELAQLNVDIWDQDLGRQEVTAHVDPDQYELLQLMSDIRMTVLDHDIQVQVNRERKKIAILNSRASAVSAASRSSSDLWFSNYHTFDEIRAWFKKLAVDHSEAVRFVPSIGTTHEGRDIFAVHVNLTPPREGKKQIWVQGLIHAREWISGAVVQYIVQQLAHAAKNYGTSEGSVPDVEFIIIPVVNPDGYAFSWTGNRLWRKNRAPGGIFGGGVDLNRNFDDHWGQGGASKIPISDTFEGPHAASEPETRAIQDYFRKHQNIVGAMDWHCYSQLILFPYGWTSGHIENYADYQRLTHSMAKAFSMHGRTYRAIQSCDLYPTSGSAGDWFVGKGAQGGNNYLPLSLAIELPPTATGGSGFILDPKHIRPVGEESWAAFVVFAQFATKNVPEKAYSIRQSF